MDNEQAWKICTEMVGRLAKAEGVEFGYAQFRIKNGKVVSPIRFEKTKMIDGLEDYEEGNK